MADPDGQARPDNATMDMGEALRTWRLFLFLAKCFAGSLGVLLILLLIFLTQG